MDAIFTLSELPAMIPYLVEEGKNTHTWLFEGPMGAGKTTLIHALAEYYDIQQSVSSPTYALVNEYTTATGTIIYHMDWYRLKDEEEAINAGIEELVLQQFCWIEWPERAIGILPDDVFIIRMLVVNETTRRVITEYSSQSFTPLHL
ncbi:tRNA (adenosine(37)-N6)-threonylcarbamoyltransferase complex ATPase subunit type 1 TsaE [Hydrotalea sp.]|uniref:tRNA (adenosine(37)-N6)-threonylcarbamoyltransferase complex ATPase subunit type 1 TsaE n=1 Tax=Hydrotalea sp. TaxID=2881279 RepID=UPI00261189DE|nr:tRNA (adenosine(37)-N6)-threonylcarbamoyltransferase complex ATPase subunit type 1 TsaE [Hydrotalea sp.]